MTDLQSNIASSKLNKHFGAITLFTLILAFVVGVTTFSTPSKAQAQSSSNHTLTYTLDRSQVPQVPFNDLTLKVDVGSTASNIAVSANGDQIPFIYHITAGIVQFSTDQSEVTISLTVDNTGSTFGTVEKAVLLDDQKWAWSHGFDDNVFLFDSMELWTAKGWAGTLNLIGDTIDDDRDEGWIVDAPEAQRRLNEGWSVAGHGWTIAVATATQPLFKMFTTG